MVVVAVVETFDAAQMPIQTAAHPYVSMLAAWHRTLETASRLVDGKVSPERTALAASLLLSVLVKWAVGLYPYSGQATPPMFGDFEAQRHWLETTAHLPVSEWYRHDVQYWGLDYPPLTAAHSWLLAQIATLIHPPWVALGASRGLETHGLKLFMRSCALVTDVALMAPAAVWFAGAWAPERWNDRQTLILQILLAPTLVLIDHGHFQFNAAMLGLSLLAFAAFVRRRFVVGSVFFVMAICFKQMALFYALPIFFYLLGICVQRGPIGGSLLLVQIGATVLGSFAACFATAAASVSDVLQIVHRVFPVHRGLYEDKVANFWCALNIVVKLRERFPAGSLVMMSAAATLAAVLPSSIIAFRRPSERTLIYATFIGSLAFFLFAFQVHEKSILLPALPASLLMLDEPLAANWFMNVAVFSMFPLLKRDGLSFAYALMMLIWNFLSPAAVPYHGHDNKWFVRMALIASLVSMLGWHAAEMLVAPPKRYPDLFVVLNVLISVAHFFGFLVYFGFRLGQIAWPPVDNKKKK